ncbi:MAG: hypothetical protein A2Y52_03915 [Sulfuricurvum sp. RIFCSPLOWO2_02_43_6]|nr:MAG: hypothetical protein A2Y52_03915 [Sulfuricurvum sp. RIFCSPLOWO2_02_43_6]
MTLNELLPTYGYWGGPGWSAGERTPPGIEPNWNYGVYDSLDALFLKHDQAYWDAEQHPDRASQIIFDADIALMRDIASGNWDSGLYGALYAPLAEAAFAGKSLWNLANMVKDELDQVDNEDEVPTPTPDPLPVPEPDSDHDGDGLPDDIDPYPNDASPDSDGDGVPDYLDPYPNDPNNGNGHPMDPAPIEPPRRDPLVLDMDKDGFISTTSLEDSTAYFDLTGDGIKEKVGWLRANDGLVVYDKNENGKIDGIDEVFGNQTTSGFDELRQTADSNYDGVIDRRDELYSRLKVWQDTNQDGILNNQDEAFNYVLLRQDNNGGVTLFIPQVDNQRAKELFENTSWHVAQNNTYFTLQKKAA